VNEEKPVVYVISDSIGETAELVTRAAIIQFNDGNVDMRRIPFVKDKERIKEVMQEAEEKRSIVVYTLVYPHLRQALEEESVNRKVKTIDLLGPLIDALSEIMPESPRLEPGLVRRLDEEYFRRIVAVEFAVKYDDGKDPKGLLLSDIVLIGVSRTSKTPLSMYLAHRRLKVANLPMVPEVEPPEELFLIPPERIIGLTIDPEQLQRIRQERLNSLGLTASSQYASMDRILTELEHANKIMRRLGCRVFEVSDKAVEEIANSILNLVNEEGLMNE